MKIISFMKLLYLLFPFLIGISSPDQKFFFREGDIFNGFFYKKYLLNADYFRDAEDKNGDRMKMSYDFDGDKKEDAFAMYAVSKWDSLGNPTEVWENAFSLEIDTNGDGKTDEFFVDEDGNGTLERRLIN